MRRRFTLAATLVGAALAATLAVAGGPPQSLPANFVYIQGGTFKNTHSDYYGKGVTVSSFYMDKYDVTQKEWVAVMGDNPSKFRDEKLPVEMVSWYDAIEYCNRRSQKEGLQPYYNIDKAHKDPNNLPDPKFGHLDKIQWKVTINPGANGYRLPTEAEWEYAAEGGQLTHNFSYSGSDDINEVGWYWRNSGDHFLNGYWNWPAVVQNHDGTHQVGSKRPNELGLYDMSGNVRQWCWDWYGATLPSHVKDPQGPRSGSSRVWHGGGWMGAGFATKTSFRAGLAANGTGPDQGFRVVRSR